MTVMNRQGMVPLGGNAVSAALQDDSGESFQTWFIERISEDEFPQYIDGSLRSMMLEAGIGEPPIAETVAVSGIAA